jgi:hypothetical protein
MHRTRTIAFLLAATIASASATQVHAARRTFVSAANGNVANTATGCTAIAPCRFFQEAMTVTDPNGEVVVLDSGGYGAVVINQSVALIAPQDVFAGIAAPPSGVGVVIDNANVNVVLRGLSINGQGGNNGIAMFAGNRLTIENCVISNARVSGIAVFGGNTVRITDTITRDNGFAGIYLASGVQGTITRVISSGNGGAPDGGFGILVDGFSPGTTTANIADSTFNGNTVGVKAISKVFGAQVITSIRDSRAVNNTGVGLLAVSDAGGSGVTLTASNNIITNSIIGIQAARAGTKVWASGNTVSDNPVAGFQNLDGGTFARFETDGTNAVSPNNPSLGPIVSVTPK